MGQFSLKRLLVSIALFAVGMGWFLYPPHFAQPTFLSLAVWMLEGMCLGAGLGLPFRHPIRGACIWGIFQTMILAAALGPR
ncbi:MAG TPA: hypothetical protein VGJ15_13485 [Pirellulales bacterium]